MKVVLLDYIVKKDKYGPDYYWLVGRLESGLEVIIEYFYTDVLEFIGESVEMLLSVLRSPYLELERGIHNQLFEAEKYYSVELIDELVSQKNINLTSGDRRLRIILTGEYIDSYTVPKEWRSLIRPNELKFLYEEPPALKTDDGVYLLNPSHMRKKIPIEKFPREVTIATGNITLMAWHLL